MKPQYIALNSKQYWKTNIALFLGSFVTFALLYCVQPLIPVFSKEFEVSPATSSLSVSLATAGLAVSMIVMSWLSDKKGRKLIMTIALLGSSFFTCLSVFSTNFYFMLFVRTLSGVMLAGFPAIAMAYINEEIDPKHVGLVMGIYVSGNSVGGLLGRIIVSAITDFFSWHIAIGFLGIVSFLISIWFWFNLPNSNNFVVKNQRFGDMVCSLKDFLRNKRLISLYSVGFLIMGAFVSLYNYISYPLMAPPYNLSQTVVGCIFFVYLIGTFSSTFMGTMADKHGSGVILGFAIACMLAGGLLTLSVSIYSKGIGLALVTFGFFGGHSVTSSWVAKSAKTNRAQASSLYLLFYYLGSSVLGAFGGKFLLWQGWNGVVLLMVIALCLAMVIVLRLLLVDRQVERVVGS
ncbi:MAG: major facilitator superfamily 1 [Firmicutes bacterium]|nr:major facilitator superfamily 1 [Bacillota bacterium]